MKMRILFIAFFYMLFCACGGLEETPDPPRRDNERRGEPKPPKLDVLEFTSWRDFLKNCKPDYDTPDNITDIAMGVLPVKISDKYLPSFFRKCFKKKSEDAHAQICEARDYWERIRKNPKSRAQKAKAENELMKLERLETDLNDKLYRLGTRARDEMKDVKEKDPKTWLNKLTNALIEDELSGWDTILDIQSYSSCTIYTDDDDDDY